MRIPHEDARSRYPPAPVAIPFQGLRAIWGSRRVPADKSMTKGKIRQYGADEVGARADEKRDDDKRIEWNNQKADKSRRKAHETVLVIRTSVIRSFMTGTSMI